MRRAQILDLAELSKILKRIEKKIDLLIEKTGREHPTTNREETMRSGGAVGIVPLLSLPDHLRKSAMTIIKLGKAMAEDVAKETDRARAIESAYLNQLTRMGYINKEKEGRRVYFSVVVNQSNIGSQIITKAAGKISDHPESESSIAEHS